MVEKAEEEDEPRCPNIELNQLVSITNVTDKVEAALTDKTGSARVAAERAVDSSIEQACVADDPDKWRCDVITLYHGGRSAARTSSTAHAAT